jgi:hypothetical protein
LSTADESSAAKSGGTNIPYGTIKDAQPMQQQVRNMLDWLSKALSSERSADHQHLSRQCFNGGSINKRSPLVICAFVVPTLLQAQGLKDFPESMAVPDITHAA